MAGAFKDFENRIMRVMVQRGCSIGQAWEYLAKVDPAEYATWSKNKRLTADGWRTWAQGMARSVQFMRAHAGMEVSQSGSIESPFTGKTSKETQVMADKFEAMVAKMVAEGMTTSKAVTTVAERYPAVHQEFLDRKNREYRERHPAHE